MRKLLVTLTIVGALLFSIAGVALADNPHTNGTTGQPSQSCQAQTEAPGGGNRSQSPGSPFTGGNADSHYAGSQPQNSLGRAWHGLNAGLIQGDKTLMY